MSDSIKVYDLANEFGLRSTELVTKLKEIGIDVKSHMSSLTKEEALKAKKHFMPQNEEKKEEKKEVKKVVRRKAKSEEVVEEKIEVKEEPKVVETERESLPKVEKIEKKIEETKEINKPLVKSIKTEDVNVASVVNTIEEDKKKLKDKFKETDKDFRKEIKKKPKSKKETKIEVVDVFEVKKQVSTRAVYGAKKKPVPTREKKRTLITVPKASKRKVRMTSDTILISDLAKELSVKSAEVVKFLFGLGKNVTVNDTIDFDTATIVANNFSYEVENISFNEEEIIKIDSEKEENLKPKVPVVTMMGHVDHGKTSILDAIRRTNIADKEAGGITQHIGAHEVKLDKGIITFIDTPGHEAFTEMRSRGSQVTDIVVLVIAADDGVMPQTKESIDHARAAGVEIVVALNKIDKPNANIDRVKKQLAELELLPEDWGGQTIVVNTNAKAGEGIKELMDAILLQAEIMELKSNANKKGSGVVIEAKLDKGMGPVATVVNKSGTLRKGDYIVAGTSYGRIKLIRNSTSQMIDALEPGRAAEILGLDSVPSAGDKFDCVDSEYDAKKLVQYRMDEKKKKELVESTKKVSFEDLMKGVAEGELREIKILVKADTQGSVEALKTSLINLSDSETKINVIHSSTGGVTVNDVNLAFASEAVIVAFNVRPDAKASEQANKVKLEIKFYDVIYNCLDDIVKIKKGLIEPVEVEKVNGQAEVRQIFNVSKIGTIAGCGVKTGKIVRNSMGRVLRDGIVIYTGKINSLKHLKDDKKEIAAGLECGLTIEGFNDIKVGDFIESYSMNQVSAEEALKSNKTMEAKI